MLSIGKLGNGHHAYYELSVASGADDFYTGHGEARGWYLGRGADALDLDGEVEASDLKHLFRGTHPRSGDEWVRPNATSSSYMFVTKANRPIGSAATPCAPRPVSIVAVSYTHLTLPTSDLV